MSLFGALYLGNSGLRASQSALNTVAHNLSNINTTGYVRQQVAQTDTHYNTVARTASGYEIQVGNGVKYSECRHIRDMFMDASYREENGRYSYYEISYSAILEVEDIVGELDGAAFKDSVSGLWSAMQELSKNPNDTVNISMLVSQAAIFVENASAVYKSLKEYQINLNNQIMKAIEDINGIGQRISELNRKISEIEVGGTENANDYRDERDLLLDKLAGYGNITYSEDEYSVVTVQFNGTDFVSPSRSFEIDYTIDEDTGFVNPYWKHNLMWKTNAVGERVPDYTAAQIFDLTEEISTEKDTDVGGLRALLLARGDHFADYTSLDINTCSERKLKALGITEEEYNEAEGLRYYNEYVKNSVVMNVQAEFDNIVHAIVTKVNEVIAQNADPQSGYLCNDDGTPMQIFQKLVSDPYERIMISPEEAEELKAQGVLLIPIYDENDNLVPNNYYRFVEEDADIAFSLYTCENLQINQKLVQIPALLGLKKEDDSADFNFGKALVEAFQNKGLYLNPNATAFSSFEGCYTDMIEQIATSGNVFKELYEFEGLSVEQAENERLTVIGVSSDEELERMIMYKNAYNAASRYINAVNSMIDSLMSMAG